MRFRGFTYRLQPSPEQAVQMDRFAGVCRLVWNIALEQRRDHWRRYQARTGNNLNYVTQARELTELRKEVGFVRAVHVTPLQRVLRALDEAYRKAWKGQGGYPRPKKKGVNDTFSFAGREVRIEKLNAKWSRIRLPKIGWVKYRSTRPVKGSVREVTVMRTVLGWQVSICCLLDGGQPDNRLTVGVDRGVTVPLMLSDGTAYGSELKPRVEKIERRIIRAQRTASRRKHGSRRYAKSQRRVASLKAMQARIRKDWAHKATTDITRRYGGVVVERLRTRNMTAKATLSGVAQKRGLNRAILNVGWHQIETMLGYKAARFEKIDPAYTSQTCAACGHADSRSRKNQASFVCTSCGHRDNADRNAAINIRQRGNTALKDVEGEVHLHPFEASTSELVLEIPVLKDGEDVNPASPS